MRILAAIDKSEYAWKVLDKAVSFAKEQGAELTVFTVIEEQYMDVLAMDAFEKLREDSQALLDKAAARAGEQGVTVETGMDESTSAAHSIIKHAESISADLIVVGHRGKSAVRRFLVGSVAVTVVTHAPCSVLVVR